MLVLQNISKTFDNKKVLQNVDLQVEKGQIAVLLGGSGCGKTTLLRIVAGLTKADAGTTHFNGINLDPIPPYQRNIGFVFQDYALFPHKNVAENIGFGLRMLDWEPAKIKKRIQEALLWVGLENFGKRTIQALSGGEQQRVALARSLAPAPQLLLLDEPLGSLDRKLRERLIDDLRPILRQAGIAMGYDAGITVLYVTHDQAEAFALADVIAIMNEGQIEGLGSPRQLYYHPPTPFTAQFIGLDNLLPAKRITPEIVESDIGRLTVTNGEICESEGEEIVLLVRPDAGSLSDDGMNFISGTIEEISFRGRYQVVQINIQGKKLRFEFNSEINLPAPGQKISITLNPQKLQLIGINP